jgi:hypothetical protein
MAEQAANDKRTAHQRQMSGVTQFFQIVSYLQYPLMLVAVGCGLKPYFSNFEGTWTAVNQALIFAGLGISFSTLQDTSRTQNEVSRKIWQDPKKGRLALLMFALMALLFLSVGMFGFFVADDGIVKEVAIGTLMLGISYIGLLKAAIEMHDRHRIDAV